MGACGCNDYDPTHKIRGPDDRWYGVAVYPSCHDCHTPTAVDFQPLDWWSEDQVERLPELPFGEMGAVVLVLDPEKLAEQLKKYGYDIEAGDLRRAVRDAVFDSREVIEAGGI